MQEEKSQRSGAAFWVIMLLGAIVMAGVLYNILKDPSIDEIVRNKVDCSNLTSAECYAEREDLRHHYELVRTLGENGTIDRLEAARRDAGR